MIANELFSLPPVTPAQMYMRFAEALNRRDFDALDALLAPAFVDHHPGLVHVTNRDDYKRNLTFVATSLDMRAFPEAVVDSGDQVFTRIRLQGQHVGEFFGIAPTGRPVEWYTNEIWRVENGVFVERWAVDDLLSLLAQIGVALPSWTAALPATVTE